jgi:hypothetical protein
MNARSKSAWAVSSQQRFGDQDRRPRRPCRHRGTDDLHSALPAEHKITPTAMSASGATAATITNAGVISAWAPLMNPPIPDAFFGMPPPSLPARRAGRKAAGWKRTP